MHYGIQKLRGLISTRWPLLGLVLVYVVVGAMLVFMNTAVAGWADPIEYMQGAQDLANYESAFHPPLYSAVMALVNLPVGDLFLAGKLVSYLAGIAIILLTWGLGRLCFGGEKIALLATALVVLSPTMLRHTYSVSADMLGTALFLAVVYMLARSSRGSYRDMVLAGILTGLACLTRAVFCSVLPAAVIFLVMIVPGKIKQRITFTLVFAVAFLVVVSPWAIHNILRHGDLHNLNYVNIAFAALDTSGSWLWFDTYPDRYPSLLSLLTQHPLLILRHVAKNALHFPAEIVVRYGLLAGVVSILGLLWALRRPSPQRMALVLNGAALLLLLLLAWLRQRFFVPLLPIIFLFAAYYMLSGLATTAASYWPRHGQGWPLLRKIPLKGPVVFLSLAVALTVSVIQVPGDLAWANIDDEKKAAAYLAASTPADTRILTSSRNLAWYADRPFVSAAVMREVSAEHLEEAVAATGAQVLVYSERHSTFLQPQLRFLLNPGDSLVPPGFRLLYHDDGEWPVVAYLVGE
ncbi:MAG: glycosyltransferase family 39 protein [Candidatus Zixiibacteriota bacterium]|nr:MAG: glycosyltransferase family 39 protein [candidate division Zixibacteria bacterium]